MTSIRFSGFSSEYLIKQYEFHVLVFVGFTLLLTLFLTELTQAQTTGDTYRIETAEGNVFSGEIISQDNRTVVIRTREAGDITISRFSITRMFRITGVQAEEIENGEVNAHPTHYFFANSAIGLEQGHWYYQNTWIFFNHVNAGITDNFSLGVGIVPLFLLGSPTTPVWLMPKVSIPVDRDNLHIAAGGMIGGLIGEDALGVGMVYGVATLGSREQNLSFGLGYGYAGSSFARSPFINISGMTRLGRSTFLISENYIFSTDESTYGLLSLGVRYSLENLAIDFGLVRPSDVGGFFIGLPWVGVTIPFGRD